MEGSETTESKLTTLFENQQKQNSKGGLETEDSANDDLFNLFMKEVGETGGKRGHEDRQINKRAQSKRAKISKLLIQGRIQEAISSSKTEGEVKVGTSEEEILRLTSRVFSNSYEVLGIPVDSDQAAIGSRYRRLSLLIHPDKATHPKAREAFEVLNKAYEELQKAENRARYKDVWKRAQELVKKEIKKNKSLNKSQQDQVEFKKQFEKQVIEMSEKLLLDLQERKEYSERCLLANHRFEQELYRQKLQEEKERCVQRKKWSEGFEERAQGWRSYRHNNSKLFEGKASFEKD
ncbi:DnaJ domain-containing protein [Cryptosporidium felis]|nr:DnaJ domain-containing protein [Cryptosporidium felis]